MKSRSTGFQFRSAGLLCFALPAFVAVGCGTAVDGQPRATVNGQVTLDGKPLPEGDIYFVTPSIGTRDRLSISSGAFRGPVLLGEREVQVSVVELKDPPPSDMPGITFTEKVPTETLPARYNAETTLSATITADGPNEFVFNLVSGEEPTLPSPEPKKKR